LPSTALKTRLFGDWKTAKKLRIEFDEMPARQGFQAILKVELIIRKYERVLVRPTPLKKTINPCKFNTYKGFLFGVHRKVHSFLGFLEIFSVDLSML
jgi:hypothetical protein